MSVINGGTAMTAIIKRNYTLPSHYRNCSLQQPSFDCWLSGYPSFPLAIEMTATDLELRAVWPCEEIAAYCARYQSWRNTLDGMYKLNSLGAYDPTKKPTPSTNFQSTLSGKVLAPMGLILNILLFVTLCSPRLKGRVFWYLRVIALMQIFQAIEKITSEGDVGLSDFNALVVQNTKKSFLFVLFYGLTNLFPFFKQIAIAMGLFVSIERFVSVFSKNEITKKAHLRYFLAAVGCSIAIATMTLFNIYLILYYDEQLGRWKTDTVSQWYNIRDWIYTNITPYAVVSFDIAASIVALGMTISVNVKLVRRSRKVGNMMGSAQVREEHKRTMDYVRLQTLDTTALVIDLCSTLFDQIRKAITANMQSCASRDCLFPNVIRRYLVTYQVSFQAAYSFEIFNGFCHAELFFLYLIFSKKFRDAFCTVWGDIYKKLKLVKCNRNH